MEKRSSILACIELQLNFLNDLKKVSDPHEVVDFEQVILDVF